MFDFSKPDKTSQSIPAFAVINNERRLIAVSPDLANVLGYQMTDLQGRKLSEFVDPADSSIGNDPFLNLDQDSATDAQIALNFACKDGRIIQAQVSANTLPHSSGHIALVIMPAQGASTAGTKSKAESQLERIRAAMFA